MSVILCKGLDEKPPEAKEEENKEPEKEPIVEVKKEEPIKEDKKSLQAKKK